MLGREINVSNSPTLRDRQILYEAGVSHASHVIVGSLRFIPSLPHDSERSLKLRT